MPPIRAHHTAIDEGTWDAGANVARLRSDETLSYYSKVFAWRDPDGDEGAKGTYKFPHHLVGADGDPGAANVRGCQSGIGVLNGAMGGADIPDGDRQGVYNHLAAHLKDADVEPADLRAMAPLPPRERGEDDRERRTMVVPELRVVEEGGQPVIVGYAAVFGQWSENLGGFVESIRPGAFAKTIQEADVRALWQHNPEQVLGRTKNGTLSLEEDEIGLRYRVRPAETQAGRDALASIRRGDVDQSSFGFKTIRDEWSEEDVMGGHLFKRELIEVKLYDVSPVTFPAYPQTSVAVRARIAGSLEGQASAPGQEPHPEDRAEQEAARARLDLARRRIEIAEREV